MNQARDSRMRSTRRRDCEPPLPEPLAYFLTWPTYGTWLPGDGSGVPQPGLPAAERRNFILPGGAEPQGRLP